MGQREEARCQSFSQLEDAGSCGNGAQSEKWLAETGPVGTSILVCPQGLSRKEWDSSVSIVPGEGFHMPGGGGRRHRIEHTCECLYKRDSGRKGGADLIPEWVACGQG